MGLKGGGLRTGGLRNLSQIEVSDIPDSAISRWSMEPDVSDSTTAGDVWGNNDGSVDGATYDSTGGPDGNGAYDFDGVDDVITTPFNPGGLSEFSVALEFEYLSVSENQPLFWAPVGSDFDRYVGLYLGSDGPVYWNNEDGNSDGRMEIGIPPNGYNWVIVTFDSGSETAYINDTVVNTNNNPLNTIADISSWEWGGQYAGNDYLDKPISDCRTYNKELSSNEVSNLVTAGSING